MTEGKEKMTTVQEAAPLDLTSRKRQVVRVGQLKADKEFLAMYPQMEEAEWKAFCDDLNERHRTR